MQFAAPATLTSDTSDRFKPAEHEHSLLLIEPLAYRADINTDSGLAEAVEATVIDLDSQEKYDNALLFGVALRNVLRNQIGQKVLARLQKGQAKPGKTAPWILVDATGDKAAVEKATAYLAGGLAAPKVETPTTVAGVDLTDPAIVALLQQQLGAKKIS